MTQQQTRSPLRASDIANAILEQEIALQTAQSYLGAILEAQGGSLKVPKAVFDGLRETEWEIAVSTENDEASFELLKGRALINKRLGLKPSGLVVPHS